jgi:cobalt/nickel transport system permease protein
MRASVASYRAVGQLVGMLLVRSVDRSQRILTAMKCRGYEGRFFVLDHFRFGGHDAALAAVAMAILSAAVVAELLLPTGVSAW